MDNDYAKIKTIKRVLVDEFDGDSWELLIKIVYQIMFLLAIYKALQIEFVNFTLQI